MKLKKIVSLALAGILAVSMLTACGDKGSSSSEGTVVTPVDNSFAAAVNEEMAAKYTNVLSFESDSALTAALNVVAEKIDSDTLRNAPSVIAVSGNNMDGYVNGVLVEDFRDMLGLKADDSFNKDRNGVNFTETEDDKASKANLFVLSGKLTDKGVAEAVAAEVERLMDASAMPSQSKIGGNADEYTYKYTGSVAVVKVDNLKGDASAYVVAMKVTQTATKAANV